MKWKQNTILDCRRFKQIKKKSGFKIIRQRQKKKRIKLILFPSAPVASTFIPKTGVAKVLNIGVKNVCI
jgi:hypothetical protein